MMVCKLVQIKYVLNAMKTLKTFRGSCAKNLCWTVYAVSSSSVVAFHQLSSAWYSWHFAILMTDHHSTASLSSLQGRSLTMGRGGPGLGPSIFRSDQIKSKVAPLQLLEQIFLNLEPPS